MLTVVVADAALELVPEEIARHPAVVSHARNRRKKPTELLLDSSLHWRAMEKLNNKEQRGRPDIIHDLLKLSLDSQLNREGRLRIFIHTMGDRVIRVNPATRIPRSYSQFIGLIEELYSKGSIKAEGEELLSIEEKPLAGLLKELNSPAIVFDAQGRPSSLRKLSERFSASRDACVVIGGFPHGDFRSGEALAGLERISLSPIELTAPAILAKAISAYELALGF